MNNRRNKIALLYLMASLCTTLLPLKLAHSYDGDVDFLAPYVTLDPESGKLVTVDPRKDQAAAAELQKQHDANAGDTTTSTESSASATPAPAADTPAGTTMSTPVASDQQTAASSPANAVIIAIGALFIIGVIVGLTRRKSSSAPDKTS